MFKDIMGVIGDSIEIDRSRSVLDDIELMVVEFKCRESSLVEGVELDWQVLPDGFFVAD